MNSPDLRVRHLTKYRYDRPVAFGSHRLMLRPRDSFDIRILQTGLAIDPPASISWMHDVYGNSVATATFMNSAASLTIDSQLLLRRYESTSPHLAFAPWTGGAPVAYSDPDRVVLAPLMAPATIDENGTLRQFAENAVLTQNGGGHPLIDLSQAIHAALEYVTRFEEGTQAPQTTLQTGRGSCRDYAWLFVEAARRLGYAARFVSGYLHNVAAGIDAAQAALTASVGYSHAWAEVYVPGDGWIEFDPTNLLVADRQLIRVSVTRTPGEAIPVSGSFTGAAQSAPPEVSVIIQAADRSDLPPGI